MSSPASSAALAADSATTPSAPADSSLSSPAASEQSGIVTDGPAFTSLLDGKRYRRISYLQCFPCYKYRGRCSSHRPCPRCSERFIQSQCIDVRPSCAPCQASGLYCNRNRPCNKCKDAGLSADACVDGVEAGRKEEDVEVDEHDVPLPPQEAEAGEGARDKDGKYKRMTESEKLQVEMMDGLGGSNKRRRDEDEEDEEDDGERKDEAQQDAATSVSATAPPPAPLDFATVLRNEQWLSEADADIEEHVKLIHRRLASLEAAPAPSHFDDQSPFIDLPTQPADEVPPPPADFLTDFNHLFPRPPLSSLSAVPTAFLNLWAHFMHKRKHSIVGHSVLLPATSASRLRHITAWDVYRSVVEHGGYHHVAQHALWHPVVRQVVLSSHEWDAHAVIPTAEGAADSEGLTGGPPVPLGVLRPRSFLQEYYEKFLLLFEMTYQWRKGSTRPPLDDAANKRRRAKRPRTALAFRNQLLNRLWPPEVSKAVHDSGRLLRQPQEADADDGDRSGAAVSEPEEVWGYIGMQRLKRSLHGEVTEEVTWAVNRLLVLSERVARRRGGWEEKDVDDEDDSSDCNLLFVCELLDDLLRLLLYVPLVRASLSVTHPALTPLLVTAHINTLVSSTPALALSSAVVTILHNLSLYYGNLRRLAANSTLVNLLVDACGTAEVWRGEAEEQAVLWGVLMRLTTALDLRVVVKRQQLLASMIDRLQHYLDTAVFPLAEAAGDSDEDESGVAAFASSSSEEAEEAVRGLISLVSNPHFSVNVPYLEAALPPSLFALLVALASPLTPSAALRLLCCQSLAYFCLTSGAFVSHIVAGSGLPTLVACLHSSDDDEAGRELRRTCAAALQAIASLCILSAKAGGAGGGAQAAGGGRGGGVRDPWVWREVKQYEVQLASACFRDADVNALLRHVLLIIDKERKEGKQKNAHSASR